MPHPSPLCAILPPCYVVGVHFGGIVWLSWAHFGTILSFILASTSHYVAIAHDFVTMLRCWDSFSHHDALYARAQIPLCDQLAILLRHVTLLRFILELLSAHFGCILVLCCALGIYFGAVIWPFGEHFDIMLCFMVASRYHTRGHCARFCRRVTLLGFILAASCGYLGGILASY